MTNWRDVTFDILSTFSTDINCTVLFFYVVVFYFYSKIDMFYAMQS